MIVKKQRHYDRQSKIINNRRDLVLRESWWLFGIIPFYIRNTVQYYYEWPDYLNTKKP